MSDRLDATIVITTKDRCDDLRSALRSCVDQKGAAIEVLVVDDASSDGTAAMLASEYPTIRVITHGESTGYIVGRNEAARAARGGIIFSIDDDAAFTSPDIVAQTLQEFDNPCVGAVAIPYADVNRDAVEHQRTPDPSQVFVADRFIGTAHAVRRNVFLQLGGYREFFFHQGEESDFCLRLMNAGYIIRLGNSDRIDHFESPRRDTRRMDLYGRRNDILIVALNVPLLWLPVHLLSVSAKGLMFGIRVGRPMRMLRGIVTGYAAAIRHCGERQAVSRKTYHQFRTLRRSGPVLASKLGSA